MKAAAVSPASSKVFSAAQPVLGVVKSTYPRIDASKPAVNDAHYSPAGELDAWARRVFAANGFGDADVVPSTAGVGAGAIALHADALKHRGAAFWEICFAIGAAIGAAIDLTIARWREQRELRRTYAALSGLDERTLKDIGLSGHEAGSIAAELAGRADRTRVQALRTLRDLSV